MSEKTFILGERRIVTLNLALTDESPVAPENPIWELVGLDDTEVEASGECQLTKDESGVFQLTALVEPLHLGLYRLYFQFTIGTEIRKPYMVIKVI